MNETSRAVDRHYRTGNVLSDVLKGLERMGRTPDSVEVDDLAPVDAFHTRGRQSTQELAELARPEPTDRVLDVGAGLGGTARYLADRYGCRVNGVDLTQEYVDVANQLTEWVGLSEGVNFTQANAINLPFAPSSFDIVWTEHVQMNVSDKSRFYGEIARVLKPAGRLHFHDIFAGDREPTFPLPWAEASAISHLASFYEAQQFMQEVDLKIVHWKDKVQESVEFFQGVLAKMGSDGPPPLGLHLLMGATARDKLTNYVRGLMDGKLTVVMGVAVKGNSEPV